MAFLALLNNLMGPDTIIIFLFILLFFGARNFPHLGGGVGRAGREFSRADDEMRKGPDRFIIIAALIAICALIAFLARLSQEG